MKQAPVVLLIVFFMPASLMAQRPAVDTTEKTHNARLAELFEEDQSDRHEGALKETTLAKRDKKRRQEVTRLLEGGRLHTVKDFFRAAMIFQHGSDSSHFKRAHDLAERAVALDSSFSTARWLRAATWDRYLLETGRPQVYGTQFVTYDGRWYLRRMDTTKVPDATREEMGLRTLAEIRAYLKQRNDTTKASLQPPPVSIEIR